jgi:hypothetical protein
MGGTLVVVYSTFFSSEPLVKAVHLIAGPPGLVVAVAISLTFFVGAAVSVYRIYSILNDSNAPTQPRTD